MTPRQIPACVDLAFASACAHEHLAGLRSPIGDDSAPTTVSAFPVPEIGWVNLDIAGTNVRVELDPRDALALAHQIADAAAAILLQDYEGVPVMAHYICPADEAGDGSERGAA